MVDLPGTSTHVNRHTSISIASKSTLLLGAAVGRRLALAAYGSAREVQVHNSRLEEVIRDFVVVRDRADSVCDDVPLVAIRLQLTPDTGVGILNEGWLGAIGGLERIGSV